jgi:nucleotide-binding universal stress UspA family protein
MACRYGSEVVVLSVLDPARFAEPPYSGLEAIAMVDQHSRSLTDMSHRVSLMLEGMDIPNRVVFLPGKTAQTIIEVARQEQVDLIVMGGETKSFLRSLLEGNLWSDVARGAHCNVLRVNPESVTDVITPSSRSGGSSEREGRLGSRTYANPLGDVTS